MLFKLGVILYMISTSMYIRHLEKETKNMFIRHLENDLYRSKLKGGDEKMKDWKLETIYDLEQIFERAIETKQGIGVLVEMPGFDEPELITNPPANLEKKLKYYKDTYDVNLNHKHAAGVRIIGYTL